MLAVKKQQSEILKDETAALKNVADAEAAEEGAQLALYQSFLQFMQSQQQAEEATPDGQGGVPGMEGQPPDAMGAPPPQGDLGAGGFGPETTAFPVDAGGPGPMGGAPITGGP
jgi:hypothetical protein